MLIVFSSIIDNLLVWETNASFKHTQNRLNTSPFLLHKFKLYIKLPPFILST